MKAILSMLQRAVLLSGMLLLSPIGAADTAPASTTPASTPDPRILLASKIPGTRAEDLRPTPIAGIYELTRGTDIAYVTTDGKYAISGDLIDLAKNDNLTETRRRDA